MQGFCLSSAGYQQAHSKLRNCCYPTEDGQKDQQDRMIIFFISLAFTINRYNFYSHFALYY